MISAICLTLNEILTLLAPVLGCLTGVEGEGVEVVPPLMVLLLGLRQEQRLDGRGDGAELCEVKSRWQYLISHNCCWYW